MLGALPTRATGTSRSLTGAGAERALAALILASCLVVPLLFTIALQDSFVLPKVTALRIIGVVGLVLLAVRLAAGGIRKVAFLWHLDAAVLAFLLLSVLAFAFSIDRSQSLNGEYLQYQGLTAILLYVGFFYLARASLGDDRRLTLLFASMAAGATVVAGYALIQKAGFDPIWGYTPRGRVFSSIGQPNALAAYLVLAIPICASLIPKSQPLARGAIALCLALMVTALALTLSRGGYMGFALAATIVAVPLIRSLRLSLRSFLYGLVPCLAGVVLVASVAQPISATAAQFWDRALSSGNLADGSVQGHLDLWSVGAAIALDYPILGAGQETYPELFGRYRDVTLAPSRARVMSAYRPESPHNVYLAIAAGSGFPALAAYVAVLVGFFYMVVRAIKATRSEWRRMALVALLAAVAGHAATDMFMTAEVTGSWLFWLLMGAGVGLARAKPREQAELGSDRAAVGM